MAGHAHILEDNGPIGDCTVDQLVSGGGGAYSRTAINDKESIFTFEGNGFVSATISSNEMKITFLDQEGKILFERNLK